MPLPVILIFDIGKTNKKLFLFDRQYKVVYEKCTQLLETEDEDGFPCEEVVELTSWIITSFREVLSDDRYKIMGVNVSAYGASFVHINQKGEAFLPLYNYLKPMDETIQKQFYDAYGNKNKIAKETASPVLGNLNSGLQLYWLHHAKPESYARIHYSIHLPQYIIFALCGAVYSDITSIGCHTALWNFNEGKYHDWVYKEGIDKKLAPLIANTAFADIIDEMPFGSGLHDSSAALVPYLSVFREPFILLSTGTWNISLNPFNHSELTADELEADCLCYFSYGGSAVKASRLFAGYDHEQQVKRLASYYHVSPGYINTIPYQAALCNRLQKTGKKPAHESQSAFLKSSVFAQRNLPDFESCDKAYHQLVFDIVTQQAASTKLVMQDTPVKALFVDGGFSKNDVFMNMLATAFPTLEVYAARVAQASAIGAAIALQMNRDKPFLPKDLISVTRFEPSREVVF